MRVGVFTDKATHHSICEQFQGQRETQGRLANSEITRAPESIALRSALQQAISLLQRAPIQQSL